MLQFLKVFIIFCVLVYSTDEMDHNQPKSREKRNLKQFGSMLEAATNRDALDYASYGCWCGKGGSGPALDGIDECCRIHDNCYNRTINEGCTYFKSPYTVLYDAVYEPDIICRDPVGTCDRSVCDCDREAAYCFARFPYHQGLSRYYDKDCEPCIGYGDVTEIKTTGAKKTTAKKENVTLIGLRASNYLVDQDISDLESHRNCFVAVARKYALHPALIGALASRVSRGGKLLTTQGYGTRDSNRYGIMQCDTNSSNYDIDCHRYEPKSCEHVEMMMREKLVPDIKQAMLHYWTIDTKKRHKGQRDAVAAYELTVEAVQNGTTPDSKTSGGDFSSDVVARAHRLIAFHKWTCNGTTPSPYLPGSIPSPPPGPGSDNCKVKAERGDCNFYLECVEKVVQCNNEGYAVGYGYKYCNRFDQFYDDFTPEGQNWIDEVRICLMKALLPHVSTDKTCKQLKNIAFDTHVDCYAESGAGFCTVGKNNIAGLWKVYNIADFFGRDAFAAWKQVLGTLTACLNEGDKAYNTGKQYLKESTVQINAQEGTIADCDQYALSGDCRFYECFESRFPCAKYDDYSHVRDFELTSCMKFSGLILSDSKLSGWFPQMQTCLMSHLMGLYTWESVDCELVELHILEARTNCMLDAGLCTLDTTDEWMLDRATDTKGFPFINPVGYTTLPESHNTLQINDYYYETLPWFKRQVGLANERCYDTGQRESKDIYKFVETEKYGKLKIRSEL